MKIAKIATKSVAILYTKTISVETKHVRSAMNLLRFGRFITKNIKSERIKRPVYQPTIAYKLVE